MNAPTLDASRRAADTRDTARTGSRFADALRTARKKAAGAEPGTRTSSAARSARAGAAPDEGSRRTAIHREPPASTATSTSSAPPTPPASTPAAADVAALRACIRALPAYLETARLADGARLSLDLGPLGIDLRSGPAGLEIALRPPAALERAASADLPALLSALAARGLTVARAEVRIGGGGGGPPPRSAR
jgi:hypothetical protein